MLVLNMRFGKGQDPDSMTECPIFVEGVNFLVVILRFAKYACEVFGT